MLKTGTDIDNITYGIDKETALNLSLRSGASMYDMFALANRVREKFHGNKVDLCSIVNAKSGACPEDCSFCAQSAHSKTNSEVYSLLTRDRIMESANVARKSGVKRFCIVTSGKKLSSQEIVSICSVISEIRELGLLPCATLGMLEADDLKRLKDAGLYRYHHNLETSESFFSEICTTHTYRDKIRTINNAKSLGLSICCGGLFGLGETWEDRIELALAIRDIGVDSVPINFFTPVHGTPMGNRDCLDPLEALKIIAIYRLILPNCEIRVCGGRPQTLRDLGSQIFPAGASGLLTGNYLTTTGRNTGDDLQMIRDMGLEI
jgi:biotin synthase